MLNNLRQFNLFHILNNWEAWYTATEAVTAPLNDLILLRRIIEYREVNPEVAATALDAYKNHLWYFSPHCVVLALFDERVSCETKRAMVANLRKPVRKKGRAPLRHPVAESAKFETPSQLRLPQFVNIHSMYFFEALCLDTVFLTSRTPQTGPQTLVVTGMLKN